MGNVNTYNPKKVTCALGNHIASGFAEDSFITIDYDGDGTSHVVGVDGEVVRSINPSNVYVLKLTLQQTSKTNDYLNKMYKKDQEEGTGTFSVNINDILGKQKFTGEIAWVRKPASWVRGKQANNREWEIVVSGGEFK